MNEWNDIAVLTPPGDIDIATVPALRRRLDALIGRGVRRVVINCQAVSFIDSTGLAFLLTRARELMRREGLLSLVNASGEVVRFLEIARLVDILHVAGSARESIPAIPVGELPRWSKSVEVRQGIENLPYYRHRIAELLESLPLRRDERYDVALASGEALGNAYDHAGGIGCVLTVQAYAIALWLRCLIEVPAILSMKRASRSHPRSAAVASSLCVCSSITWRLLVVRTAPARAYRW